MKKKVKCEEKNMKQLINMQTSLPIVEFLEEKTIIYSKFLENEMRTIGISIPPGLRGVYQGKDNVRLEDQGFQKAFKEIFYLTSMDHGIFQWKEK